MAKSNDIEVTIGANSQEFQKALDALSGKVKSLAGAFGVGFGLREMVGMEVQLYKNAQGLQHLSQESDFAKEDILLFRTAFAESKLTTEEAADALVTFREAMKLPQGETVGLGVVLKSLIGDLGELKSLSPAEQIDKVTDALQGLSNVNGARSQIATLLFGKRGGSIVSNSPAHAMMLAARQYGSEIRSAAEAAEEKAHTSDFLDTVLAGAKLRGEGNVADLFKPSKGSELKSYFKGDFGKKRPLVAGGNLISGFDALRHIGGGMGAAQAVTKSQDTILLESINENTKPLRQNGTRAGDVQIRWSGAGSDGQGTMGGN